MALHRRDFIRLTAPHLNLQSLQSQTDDPTEPCTFMQRILLLPHLITDTSATKYEYVL